MISSRKHSFVAFIVRPRTTPGERLMQVRRIAVRHLRNAAPSTRVYVRFNGPLTEAVVLYFHNSTPQVKAPYSYQEASLWIEANAGNKPLDSSSAAA